MDKFIFIISAAITCIPICKSFDIPIGQEQIATPCMFGPFKDSAMECVTRHHRFTGCILKDLNWFRESSILSQFKVLVSFSHHVTKDHHWRIIKSIVLPCVSTANSNSNNNRNETADKFVECLDEQNAFASIFPRIFCRQKNTTKSTASNSVPRKVRINASTCAFNRTAQKFLACFIKSSTPDDSRNNSVNSCAFGPFITNAIKCLVSRHQPDGCFLDNFNYFAEGHKINMTKLLDFIRPYIINSEYAPRIDEVMNKCVTIANIINGTAPEVSHEFRNCFIPENGLVLFSNAFCPE